MRRRFPPAALAEFESTKYLYIRTGDHRFIAIWDVVVDGRVVVRSWNDKPAAGIEHSFRTHAAQYGLTKGKYLFAPCAFAARGLNDAADAAYASKYRTKANAKYVEGFKHAKRKATTLELIPA
jgi:hypothetical protein